MLPNKIPLLILAAVLGGFALVGMIVVVLNMYIAVTSGMTPAIAMAFVVLAIGAIGGAGSLWLFMRRLEKNVLKQLGLDK